MELTLLESNPSGIRAGYSCPCGCTPSVEFARGAELVEEGCCCGNHFAVGPKASATLVAKPGFHPEQQAFDAPWGERLEAAWLVGPSVHGPADEHDDHHDRGDHNHESGGPEGATQAVDPVCGMTVDPATAEPKGLHSTYNGADYFFCGKGCKLEFDEDPERYLDSSYVPSM
ncbi:MAG: YHS domain-containing protein [Chloroflexi bacterium]|nr:YHS domain-containing protein [Chloroflexota bacterium]